MYEGPRKKAPVENREECKFPGLVLEENEGAEKEEGRTTAPRERKGIGSESLT